MTEWQPIETAPKDGTWVLGYWRRNAGVTGFVGQCRWIPRDFRRGHPAMWDSRHDGFLTPTHWMPLPEPPALKEKQDD